MKCQCGSKMIWGEDWYKGPIPDGRPFSDYKFVWICPDCGYWEACGIKEGKSHVQANIH